MTIREALGKFGEFLGKQHWTSNYGNYRKQEKRMVYCDMCGRKLVNVIIPTGYNGYTGEQQYLLYLKCPNITDQGLALVRASATSEEKRCFLSSTNDIMLGWCTKDGSLLD